MAITDVALIPGSDYVAACNAIRSKTGKTEPIKSGQMAEEIESISAGGIDNGIVINAVDDTGYCTNVTVMGDAPAGIFNQYDSLEAVTFSGTRKIGMYAFPETGISSITIPETLETIGESAFTNCPSLTTLNYNATDLQTVYNSTSTYFEGSPLNNIVFGTGVHNIPDRLFAKCALEVINIPETVNYIGREAFKNCQIKSVTIPRDLSSLGDNAFVGCPISTLTYAAVNLQITYDTTKTFFTSALTNIIWGANAQHLPNCIFRGCTGLPIIALPNTFVSIGQETFQGCTGITDAIIPDSVVNIGIGAFQGCTSLTSAQITGRLQVMHGKTFSGCTSLRSLRLTSPVLIPMENPNAFENTPISGTGGFIYVPDALVDAYKNSSGWSNFATKIRPISSYTPSA